MAADTYLLDTGILVGYVRDADYARFVDAKYAPNEAPNLALLSIVSHGEIFSLAYQFGWGKRKRRDLQQLLSDLLAVEIYHDEIIERYAEIDAYSKGKLPDNPLPEGESSYTMGKNDLWIAATASVVEATLLTTDKDYDHLHGEFLERIYIDPENTRIP